MCLMNVLAWRRSKFMILKITSWRAGEIHFYILIEQSFTRALDGGPPVRYPATRLVCQYYDLKKKKYIYIYC